jgi:hypothetical protein
MVRGNRPVRGLFSCIQHGFLQTRETVPLTCRLFAENQGTFFGYQGQVKYRYQPQLEFGAQIFSWLGQVNNWDNNQQQTSVGPAIFGKTKLGNKQAIAYNLAYLWGTTEASPKNTLRLQVEYEY